MLTVILYAIYYCLMLGGMILLSFLFSGIAVFDASSVIPILVVLLMLWQAYSLNKHHSKKDAEDEKQLEINDYIRCVTHSYLICAPLCFPMIFFLTAFGKSISVLPLLIAMISGGAVYKRRKLARDAKKENEESENEN